MILDVKLVRGRISTMDPDRPTASAVGVWRGRIVGLDDDVADLPAKRTVDLDGATVLPGFIDAHTHLRWAGQARRAIDLSPCRTAEEVLDAVRGAVGEGWIEGSGYDRRALDRPVTAADLDTVKHLPGKAGRLHGAGRRPPERCPDLSCRSGGHGGGR